MLTLRLMVRAKFSTTSLENIQMEVGLIGNPGEQFK